MRNLSNYISNHFTFKGFIWALLTIVLFIYIFIRSIRLNITHDEALSWSILMGDSARIFTANNHWLNTLLSWPLGGITDYQPWALRLPNALSFLLYSYFIFKLTTNKESHWLILIPVWIFLLANHYLLELFGLFRGYGLALTCCAGSLYYAQKYLQKGLPSDNTKFQIFALLTVYANYAFLYPILGMMMLLAVKDRRDLFSYRDISRRYKWTILLSVPAIYNIFQLKNKNELYFGGEEGIFKDCLNSVIRYSFQFEIHPFQFSILQWTLISLLIILVFSLTFRATVHLAPLLLYFCLLLPIPLHYLFGMKFPMERSVIYLTLLMGISVYAGLILFYQNKKWIPLVILYITLLTLSTATLYGFWYRFNFRYASTWYYDEHNWETLERIALLNPDKKITSVGISWVLEPSFNYYRIQKKLSWLLPLNRDPLNEGGHDYYYVFEGDTAEIPDEEILVHFYPDTRTILMQGKISGN